MRALFAGVALLLLCVAAEPAADAAPKTLQELRKLPLKHLRAMLADRGVDCVGCSEKVCRWLSSSSPPLKPRRQSEVANRVFETQHLPVTGQGVSAEAERMPPPEHFDHASLMKKMQKDRDRNAEFKKKLQEAGVNTDGINFGGDFGAAGTAYSSGVFFLFSLSLSPLARE
jgi:hypothetical protein